jgi:hypothetical protein
MSSASASHKLKEHIPLAYVAKRTLLLVSSPASVRGLSLLASAA